MQGLMENGQRIVYNVRCKIGYFCSIIWFLMFCLNNCFANTQPIIKQSPLLLEVTINQDKLPGIIQAYEDTAHHLWISRADLIAWKLPTLKHSPLIITDTPFYSLDWYRDIEYRINRKQLALFVRIPAKYFPATVIQQNGYDPDPIRPTIPGVFINYDVTAIHNTHLKNSTHSALLEAGFSNPFGIFSNDVLASNYHSQVGAQSTPYVIRLNTAWTLDQPENIATWRIGDAITGASSWSSAIRFGGIQYATNFSTQPNFITFPLPSIRGEAVIPTNVQIFVNGVLNQQQNINNGAYVINNIPVVTGSGTVNVVTQDLLGRTQLISLPYYTSPQLLKRGISDYSYEIGRARENYGIESNHYSDLLASATYQYGITDTLTVGSHLELLAEQKTLGISSDYLLNQFGTLSFAAAGSYSPVGTGWLGSVGFIRQTPHLNVGIKSTYMTAQYQQLGLQVGELGSLGATISHQVFFGYDLGKLGSIGLSYTTTKLVPIQDTSGQFTSTVSQLGTLSYSRNIATNIAMNLSAIQDFKQSQNNQVYASLIFLLDNVHTVNTYGTYQQGDASPAVLLTRNLPLGEGYGYHVVATNSQTNGPGFDGTYQSRRGTYTAKAYQVARKNYYEADISGAVVYMDGRPHLSRKLSQSYALVQVPGYENVRVYYQNQLMGKTNADGNLLVPDILSYQNNTLAIEPRDLPLLTDLKQTSITLRPYYHSGLIAKFTPRQSDHVLLRLLNHDGKVVPPGAKVKIDNQRNYLVGYEGMLYLKDMKQPIITGQVMWPHHECHFRINKTEKQLNEITATDVLCET